MNCSFFTVFLKNRNISSKIKRSKVTDYAALTLLNLIAQWLVRPQPNLIETATGGHVEHRMGFNQQTSHDLKL